jgi:hypothetical protein
MYAASLATAEPLTTTPLTRRPQGDFSAACTQRLPGTTADGLVVPTSRGPRDYANLDHAASTPALTVVAEAVERTLRTYASVHRGNGFASRVTSEWYEQAREEVARFIGAREDDLVVFTRTTTDSWNLLARTLPADTTVVVFASEHHSTLLPWGTRTSGATVTLPVPRTVEDGLAWLDSALAESTGAHTLVVVVRRLERHRRGLAGRADRRRGPPARRPGRPRRRAACPAPGGRPRRLRRRLRRVLRPQALRPLRRRRPRRSGRLARRRRALPRRRWRDGSRRTSAGSPGPPVRRVTRAAAPTSSAPSPSPLPAPSSRSAGRTSRAYEHTLAERLRRGLEQIPGVHTHSLFGRRLRPGRRGRLHDRRSGLLPRVDRPVGRARDRRARRQVLRPPARRRAPRGRRRGHPDDGRPGQPGPGLPPRARRAARLSGHRARGILARR